MFFDVGLVQEIKNKLRTEAAYKSMTKWIERMIN